MKNKDVDVFIISYNRLSYFELFIDWLENAGFENIHIVDNASTYPPLLEYLDKSKYNIHRMEKNYGHLVVWESGKFDEIIKNKNYIVSDCDILPVEKCPLDVTEYFERLLKKYPNVTKVGFGLKIDDLPQHNALKMSIVEWEEQFWKKKIEEGLYDAPVDTTFALYRPNIYPTNKKWWKSIRTDYPYIARHLPWYCDSSNPSKEDIYYQETIQNRFSFWSVTDLDLLKKYNSNLLLELDEVYSSFKWKLLQVIYIFLNLFVSGDRFERKIGKKNKQPKGNLDSVATMQEYNKNLFVELGSIQSSGGWQFLLKIENFFHLS